MAMFTAEALHDLNVFDTEGSKIGKVDAVFDDANTGQSEWVAVKTGMFGSKASFVPINHAQMQDGALRVPFAKSQIKDSPRHDLDRPLSRDDEQELYTYYDHLPAMPTTGMATAADGAATTGFAEPNPASAAGATTGMREPLIDERSATLRDPALAETTGDLDDRGIGDDAMTRSEERLQVGTERRDAGQARLRKHVVTEQVTQTVPVRHEEVHVEREPITDTNREAAMSGPELTESEHEVTLHEERPLINKETVPVERVRLGTDEVTEQAQVDESLRKEQIDVEGAPEGRNAYPEDPGATSTSNKRRTKR